MSRSLRHWVISLFILLARGSGWLMLWTLGFYLTHNGQQAALFLPHGVYLALLILLSRRYWPALVLPPVLMLFWLHSEQLVNGYILLVAPLISLIPASIGQSYWHRFPLYWQRLTLLLAAVTITSLLNTLLLSPFIQSPATLIGLASFTGGVLLTPFVYLIYEFLRQQHRYHLLGLDTTNPPLRTSLIIWCSLFFIIGIGTQMVLSPEIERLLLIVVFLPNVVMAWKFGWQGGVLSGLLGSMMITIARQIGVGFSNLLELEIFLATQALLGIGLRDRYQPPAASGAKPAPLSPASGSRTGSATRADRTTDPHRGKYAQKPGAGATRRNWSEHHRHSNSVATGQARAGSRANA